MRHFCYQFTPPFTLHFCSDTLIKWRLLSEYSASTIKIPKPSHVFCSNENRLPVQFLSTFCSKIFIVLWPRSSKIATWKFYERSIINIFDPPKFSSPKKPTSDVHLCNMSWVIHNPKWVRARYIHHSRNAVTVGLLWCVLMNSFWWVNYLTYTADCNWVISDFHSPITVQQSALLNWCVSFM